MKTKVTGLSMVNEEVWRKELVERLGMMARGMMKE